MTLLSELRFAGRRLASHPSFAVTAIIILAAGLAGSVSLFGIFNGLVRHPLPYRAPSELVHVSARLPKRGIPEFALSTPEILDYRNAGIFADIGLYYGRIESYNLAADGDPERITGQRVSTNLLSVLGADMVLGRGFEAAEEGPGNDAVAVLSHGFWQRRYAGDPSISGTAVALAGVPRTIVGVAAENVVFPSAAVDLWLPTGLDLATEPRRSRRYSAVARLKPGETVDSSLAAAETVAERLAHDYPDTNTDFEARVIPLFDQLFGQTFARTWTVAFASVLLLLVIASVNLSNLMVTRATVRQREIVLRRALGASLSQVLSSFLAEALLVTSVGCVLGVGLAYTVLLPLTSALLPNDLPGVSRVVLDGAAVGFAVLLAIVVTIVLAAAPAVLPALRPQSLTVELKEGARGSSSRAGERLRCGLVISEIGLALALLVASVLVISTFINLQRVDRGLRQANVVAARVTLPENRYRDDAATIRFFDRVLDELASHPGIRSASMINELPTTAYVDWATNYTIAGEPQPGPGQEPVGRIRVIGPDYFETMGIRIEAGRPLERRDRADQPQVAAINRTFAEMHFPGGDPIGRRITIRDQELEIVAVVGDVQQAGPRAEVRPAVYRPYSQLAMRSASLVVWSDLAVDSAAKVIRAAVGDVDPTQALYDLSTLEQALAHDSAQERALARIFAVFILVASLLAATGLYGVVAYGMAQRRREIGVRMALGASSADVLRMALTRGLGLSAAGLVVGLILATAATRLLEPILFGIGALDWRVLTGAGLFLLLVAMGGTWLPARRAAATDPIHALRAD